MFTSRQTGHAVEPVAALHCSGATAGEWRSLRVALGPAFDLFAPHHYGCDEVGPWHGERVFTLADEAARTIEFIDSCKKPVHLVGHSYGGGVALHVALRRPGRIASLALYEPSAFNLLPHLGSVGSAAYQEIEDLVSRTDTDVLAGSYASAAARFIEYWGGQGAWSVTRESVRISLKRWMPKAPLDFRALIHEPVSFAAYADLRVPVLIMRGEHAPSPTRLIAENLVSLLPNARLSVVRAAGHMGPISHPDIVATRIADHLMQAALASECPCSIKQDWSSEMPPPLWRGDSMEDAPMALPTMPPRR